MKVTRRPGLAIGILLAALAMLIAYLTFLYKKTSAYPAPVRLESKAEYPKSSSVLVAPISLSLTQLQRGPDHDLPRKLWSINKKLDDCVPQQKIRIFAHDIKVTPKIGCRIVGDVRRGALKLVVSGKQLQISFPINAVVRADDIGGIIKRETATGSANVTLTVAFEIARNWEPEPKINISYRWDKNPGIDFLGQRISFASRADKALAPVIKNVERSLTQQIVRADLRTQAGKFWSQAFTTLSLNRKNPPVWLRVTPHHIGISSFRVSKGKLWTNVMLAAQTEVFVGDRPDPPLATPLPNNTPVTGTPGLEAALPVLASYKVLEPVILRALKKLAAKGPQKDVLGPVDVEFHEVSFYPTAGNKIAVGVTLSAEPTGSITGRILGKTKGQIWLTATPISEAGSEIISIKDLQVFGNMDTMTGDLAVRVMKSKEVLADIENALVKNFSKKYQDILQKAEKGISHVRMGDLTMRMDMTEIEHGAVQVTSAGLFMSVTARGKARVTLGSN